jgi:hypothetical protein
VCGKSGIVCSVIVEHVWNFSDRACIKSECFTVKRVFAKCKFTRAVRVSLFYSRLSTPYNLFRSIRCRNKIILSEKFFYLTKIIYI